MVHIRKHRRQMTALILFLTLTLSLVLPCTVNAKTEEKEVVRVGWYDSSYNTLDATGRRSGYAYEYQLKLSAYNGWSYEYISGSWPDLLHMLETGEIDLMSDVSYTPKREEHMLFSSLPMGTEEYYLFTAPGNTEISSTNCATLNGKRVGVNRDSIQKDFYLEWAESKGVQAKLVEVTCTEDESLQKLEDGELDAYITVDAFMEVTRAVPMYKIGSSDFYFAVSKKRPDLLAELDLAMSKIQDENRYYNSQMFEKYIRRTGANAYLSADETQWLSAHGTIRVGYQDNYLAFCAADPETGELTGVLDDYLKLASDCIPNAPLQFKATAYPTVKDAMDAMKSGDVDCVFPANFSGYDAEMQSVIMSPAIMDTEILAVVRMTEPDIFSKGTPIVAAVNTDNLNYDAFLAEHFPAWEKVYCPDTQACLKAVSAGEADCILISNYRYNNIRRQCDRYHLTTLSVGVELDYCFAVKKGQTALYSILAKTSSMIPDSAVNAALLQYTTESAQLTLSDFIADNFVAVMVVSILVFLVFLFLLTQSMLAVKKARHLISATETDDLTGLYNRKFFFQYANHMYHTHVGRPMDAVVLNIEQFHSINEIHGRESGDRILREFGNEIRAVSRENKGIAGRFEADRFDIYCRHIEDYHPVFARLQEALDAIAPSTNIRLRMGVMPWQEKLEPEQLFDRARTACNMARGHYRERLIIYDDIVSAQEHFEQRLVNDLRRALDAHEFEVYYQPKFDIRTEPASLAGAEALVRWQHPELGMIAPADFVPLLEKNGQVGLLDRYVWSQAAAQIAKWQNTFGVTVPISVNLSRVDMFDTTLEDTLEEILQKNGLDHTAFRLEITESVYTEHADQVIQVVERLRDKGYKIEMDDFGTGYSSLNMLSAMPIDALKMDRGFIRNIEHDEKDHQLVALILDIAKNLKVPVIAEGVETEAQMKLLRQLDCAMVQGYYFSRPLPANEFEKKYFGA